MKAIKLVEEFKKYDIGPYVEVTCSMLDPLIKQLIREESCEVMNPVSEAVAMGLASGAFMITGKVPVILMQNSGLCNVLNALISLNQEYSIPVLYLISWRGEPGTKDAPQHTIMGAKTEEILRTLEMPYTLLSEEGYKGEVSGIMDRINDTQKPAALILRKGVLEKSTGKNTETPREISAGMTKSEAVEIILRLSRDRAYFVTTNGFISREAFYALNREGIEADNPLFYMLGSMGHALPIGMGITNGLSGDRKVVVLDGDGGALMHLGAMASVGSDNPRGLVHVVLDNGTYSSTGGQPTVSGNIDFCKIAEGCGYAGIQRFSNIEALKKDFIRLFDEDGPIFAHVIINNFEGGDRTRISERYSCEDIKDRFVKRMRHGKN